jgi:hypothetical protein
VCVCVCVCVGGCTRWGREHFYKVKEGCGAVNHVCMCVCVRKYWRRLRSCASHYDDVNHLNS